MAEGLSVWCKCSVSFRNRTVDPHSTQAPRSHLLFLITEDTSIKTSVLTSLLLPSSSLIYMFELTFLHLIGIMHWWVLSKDRSCFRHTSPFPEESTPWSALIPYHNLCTMLSKARLKMFHNSSQQFTSDNIHFCTFCSTLFWITFSSWTYSCLFQSQVFIFNLPFSVFDSTWSLLLR